MRVGCIGKITIRNMVKSFYLIGSLRNESIPDIGNKLRDQGFDVFDQWWGAGPEADDYFKKYADTLKLTYKEALQTYAAKHIFEFDKKHLDRCDGAILVMPGGKSAHLELGYMAGQGKKTYVLFDEVPTRYDLMYQFCDGIFFDLTSLISEIKG